MMKKLLSLAVIALALCGVAGAQGNPQTKGRSILTHVGGVYDSVNYSYWSLQVDNPASVPAASPATLILRQGTFTMPDGRVMAPFVGEIVTIGAGTSSEAVTLTAVSGCYLNAPVDSCTITGNTANAHGRGDLVTTNSGGILEAQQDAALNGGGSVYFEVDCGSGVALNTGAVTTTLTCKAPNTFTNLGASVFVNTTITTSASYSVGITGATTAFVTSCTSLTAGQNCSQFVNAPAQTKQGTGLSAVLVTTNATAGAGAVHVKVWGYIGVQALS